MRRTSIINTGSVFILSDKKFRSVGKQFINTSTRRGKTQSTVWTELKCLSAGRSMKSSDIKSKSKRSDAAAKDCEAAFPDSRNEAALRSRGAQNARPGSREKASAFLNHKEKTSMQNEKQRLTSKVI